MVATAPATNKAPTPAAPSLDGPVPATTSDLRERRRRFLSTTPGLLRAESIAVALIVLLAGLLTSFVAADQGSSVRSIREEAEPGIQASRRIQTSLAEANASAATTFLGGGVEDATERARYTAALARASAEIEEATKLVDRSATASSSTEGEAGDEEGRATRDSLTSYVTQYAGLIESARANNRQGYPVGAAYLSEASALLETQAYPATDELANDAAADYRSTYDSQRGGLTFILAMIAIALIALCVLFLVYIQIQLRQRFKRTINLPLAAATIVAIGLGLWMAIGTGSNLAALNRARTDGYDGSRLYLDVRGVGFGAKTDEARFLIARGAGEGFQTDFEQRAAEIERLFGPLEAQAAASDDPDANSRLDDVRNAWSRYETSHQEVIDADRSGARDPAIELALGDSSAAFATFHQLTDEAIEANRATFVGNMNDAGNALRGLRFGALIAAAVIAALALNGIQLRINEYR